MEDAGGRREGSGDGDIERCGVQVRCHDRGDGRGSGVRGDDEEEVCGSEQGEQFEQEGGWDKAAELDVSSEDAGCTCKCVGRPLHHLGCVDISVDVEVEWENTLTEILYAEPSLTRTSGTEKA